jgi:hypothetical protein
MYMVETAATVPLATSPTVNSTEVATPTY